MLKIALKISTKNIKNNDNNSFVNFDIAFTRKMHNFYNKKLYIKDFKNINTLLLKNLVGFRKAQSHFSTGRLFSTEYHNTE